MIESLFVSAKNQIKTEIISINNINAVYKTAVIARFSPKRNKFTSFQTIVFSRFPVDYSLI